MRIVTCLVAAGLAAATTGCIETMDSGYGSSGYSGYSNPYYSGYSDPYYSNSGYSQPTTYRSTNNYYYQPAPTVVRETRYVPVPQAAPQAAPQPQQRQRNADRPRAERRRDDNNAGGSQQQTNRRPRNNEDRDGDGQPDRRERRNRS